MGAYIAVLDHPFFSVTDHSGKFSMPALEPGKYTIEAWHEVFGKQTQEIEVKDSSPVHVNFTFKN
jgi:uncharacterized protein (DUF2141 family)